MSFLGVSIVTYKHSFLEIEQVIKSIMNTDCHLKLTIVDNSPTAVLKEELNNLPLEYISNPANPGYGAAHNLAIKDSITQNATYHLVINPDVQFKPGTLEKLIGYMEANPQIGNLMPKTLYSDGTIQYLCKLLPTPYDWIGRRFNPFKKMVHNRNKMFELQFTGYNKVMEVPYLSGCFMFLRISALKEIGLFDENIFMYGEETDLCRRLINGGYRTVFFPEAEIVHGFQKGSHTSLRLTLIGMQSAIYYFNKWGWFFDSQRKRINSRTLVNLGYKTID